MRGISSSEPVLGAIFLQHTRLELQMEILVIPCWDPHGVAASPEAEGASQAALLLGRREAARLALRSSLDRCSSSFSLIACR